MDHLEKSHLINEKNLDQRYYFQSFFQEACRTGQLTDYEIERIQLELVELMGKEVVRFTNDESSSIPVEKAQDILQSITYSMGYFLKITTDVTQKLDILKTERINELYYKGMKAVSECKTRAYQLLQELQKSCLRYDNIAYQDTIYTGLPPFFHDYDIEFGANENPGSIDYPLFREIDHLTGAEFTYEYLRRLTLEDSFLRCFPKENINQLLKGFDKAAEHMLVNIFELVLFNALGCVLLGQQSILLHIGVEGKGWLQNHLEACSKNELEQEVMQSFDNLSEELELEPETRRYTEEALPNIINRLYQSLQTKTLDRIFISFPEQHEEEYFIDGNPIEDKKLRLLIDQLHNIQSTEKKVAVIKENIESASDFIELLEECFYEEEYQEVFSLLGEADKEMLKRSILWEYGQEHANDFEPQKLWQKILLQ